MIRLSLTEAEAKALLVAIASMEGDDDEEMLRHLDKADDKIRAARRQMREKGYC